MPDMLVKLYELPAVAPLVDDLASRGVTIRRALPPEKHKIVSWVREEFGARWASECDVALSGKPVGCFVAVSERDGSKAEIVGFACHDATCKNFFGPTGVKESERGKGIGKALLIAALHAMREQGYGYAIIGGVGPADFYARVVGATVIEGSSPGIYRGML